MVCFICGLRLGFGLAVVVPVGLGVVGAGLLTDWHLWAIPFDFTKKTFFKIRNNLISRRKHLKNHEVFWFRGKNISTWFPTPFTSPWYGIKNQICWMTCLQYCRRIPTIYKFMAIQIIWIISSAFYTVVF